MNFSTAIVTVPNRLVIARSLANQLKGELVIDMVKNGSWWGHKQALLKHSQPYHLVLEDDVKLCTDFIEGLDQICGLFPDHPVSLFNMGFYKDLNERAQKMEMHFVGTNGATGQAQLWPVKTLNQFILWCDKNIPETILFEDTRLWYWLKTFNKPIFLTCPNLVQHDIHLKSELGFKGPLLKRDSADYLGPRSAALINWTSNLESAKKTHFKQYDYSTFWKKQGFKTC